MGFDADPRGSGHGGDVAADVAESLGLSERRPERAVGLVSSRGSGAGGHHVAVRLFQMLGFKPIESMLPQSRREMLDDGGPVGVIAGGPKSRAGELLEPVVEPGGHGPVLAHLAHSGVVAVLLQRPDLCDDSTLRLAAHVSSIDGAVGLEPDGDASVPAAVFAEIDRRRSVGVAADHLEPALLSPQLRDCLVETVDWDAAEPAHPNRLDLTGEHQPVHQAATDSEAISSLFDAKKQPILGCAPQHAHTGNRRSTIWTPRPGAARRSAAAPDVLGRRGGAARSVSGSAS